MSFVPATQVVSGASVDPKRPRTALVLHGILGSSRNWRTFARNMVRRWPAWRLVLVDLRNHGDSMGAPPPHTLRACASDLDRLAGQLDRRPEIVMGHSFGGKAALTYGREFPEGLAQVWALDATPEGGVTPTASDNEVVQVIRALEQIPLPLARREDIVGLLREAGFSEMLARWMTTNLEPVEGGFTWRFDLPAVRDMLADYYREDLFGYLERATADVHFVRAGRSDRWTDDLVARIEAASDRTRVHLLPDSGHWVHVDDPSGLMEILELGFG